jgi:hypothetical protein
MTMVGALNFNQCYINKPCITDGDGASLNMASVDDYVLMHEGKKNNSI